MIPSEPQATEFYHSYLQKRGLAEGNGYTTELDSRTGLRNFYLSAETIKKLDGSKPSKQGGIDFRVLPGVAASSYGSGHVREKLMSLARSSQVKDLDAEWQAIRTEMQGARLPYARIKGYIAVCSQRLS